MGPGNSEQVLADCQKRASAVKISQFRSVLYLPFGTVRCDGEAFPVPVECSQLLRTLRT
jgi:hypothetical protein